MALLRVGTVVLPPHRGPGGFDHASVYRGADRLYVAHTANDSVEVIDLGRRIHEATLDGFPGVAGAAVCEQRRLLAATCWKEGTVALAALDDPATITRISVGARPNGLAASMRNANTSTRSFPVPMQRPYLQRADRQAAGPPPGSRSGGERERIRDVAGTLTPGRASTWASPQMLVALG